MVSGLGLHSEINKNVKFHLSFRIDKICTWMSLKNPFLDEINYHTCLKQKHNAEACSIKSLLSLPFHFQFSSSSHQGKVNNYIT